MSAPKLGVIFHPTFLPETLTDYARRAEAAGFDELWLWEDCFFAGALTSAATALAATEHLKVGIGLMPATVRNPLFVAMEITTLARLYPGRFLPGFGHGLDSWMKQIGAAPKSSLRALEDTLTAVRGLLRGEHVTLHSDPVDLDAVQLQLTPLESPPLLVGAIREKTLRLSGRAGDGTLLTEMSSPAYIHWAREQVNAGMLDAGRESNPLTVYLYAKIGPDGAAARQAVRPVLAGRLTEFYTPHLQPLGIADEAAALIRDHGADAANHIPDAWIDELAAAGTPEQGAASVLRLAEAGADTVVLLPLNGDPAALDEYSRYLLPLLKNE